MIYNEDYIFMVPVLKNNDGTFNKVPNVVQTDRIGQKTMMFPNHVGDWHGWGINNVYPTAPDLVRTGEGHIPSGGISFRDSNSVSCGVNWTYQDVGELVDPDPTSLNNINCERYNMSGRHCWLISPKMANMTNNCNLSGRYKVDNVSSPTWNNRWAFYDKYNDEFILRINSDYVPNPIMYMDFWYVLGYNWDRNNLWGLLPKYYFFNNNGDQHVVPDYLDDVSPQGTFGEVHIISDKIDAQGNHERYYLIHVTDVVTGKPSWISFPRIGLEPVTKPPHYPCNNTVRIVSCGWSITCPQIENPNWSSTSSRIQPIRGI